MANPPYQPSPAAVAIGVPSMAPPPAAPAAPDLSQPPDHFLWRYCVSMLMELKEGSWALSIGRVLLLVTFLHAMVTWSVAKDIADHEMDTLYGLLAYVLGGKITDAIKTWRK